MIIDCHSHIWPSVGRLGRAEGFSCLVGDGEGSASTDGHWASCQPANGVCVLGFVSNHLNAEISNDSIGEYVAGHSGRMVGFAGIDPTSGDCLDDVRKFHDDSAFAGLTLSPACQGIHPCDTRVMRVYELAEELGMPIYVLQGEKLPSEAVLPYAEPALLDEVARTFGSLTLVISHLGFPWLEETVSLLGKHANVYADLAGLAERPWQAYRSLICAHEQGVIGKLLFASDYPAQTVKSAAEALYNVNKFSMASLLPAVPREQLRSIIERDSSVLLGLSASAQEAVVTED